MLREHSISVDDRDLWNKYLPPNRSVFGSHGYALVCGAFRDSVPRLYVVESVEAAVAYPFLLRPLSALPFPAAVDGAWDSTTPDFTGPMTRGRDPLLIEAFPGLRDSFFRQIGVVAEFAHLYPWSENADVLLKGKEYSREIIWIDLTLGPDILWASQFDHACRKNINRAQTQGVRIRSANSDEYLSEFVRIYSSTMQRNHALESYYFPLDFFKAIRDEMPGSARFVFAEYRDQIVAATLYMHDDRDVFSFLGGADAEFQQLRPTNAVIWDTVRWAIGEGKKRFILGGGYKPDDGIFRFKSTFSKLRQSFFTYKRIHREQDYKQLELCNQSYSGPDHNPGNYFPSYRSFPQQVPVR